MWDKEFYNKTHTKSRDRKNGLYRSMLRSHLWWIMGRKLASSTCKWTTHKFKRTPPNKLVLCLKHIYGGCVLESNLLQDDWISFAVVLNHECTLEPCAQMYTFSFITICTLAIFKHLLNLLEMDETASGSGSSFDTWNN